MTLTFSPALQTTTALPVAPTGRASFRFSASFSSRDEYNHAHREGSRLEIWTNLPVGDHSGSDWHALAFSYPEDSAAETTANDKVFTLTPTTPEVANKTDNATVVLDLTLSNARPGAVYSFTYRLVHASGAIEWLGAYGQNGDLVVEEKDVRFTLAQGSTLEHGAIVNADLNADIDAVTLGTLDKSVDWVSWGFSEDGCKASYSGLSVPPSSAVLLVPRPTDTRLVDVQPLLLKAYGGAVSVTSNGDLVRHNGLAVLDVSEAFTEATVLPGSSIISIQNGFAIVASAGKDTQDVPTSLSFIPISREAWTTPSTEIRLTEANIRSILGSKHTDAVIVDSSVSTFGTWKADEDLIVRVSAPGAQCVIAPVYSLPTAKEDESVSLALITTSASARVEVVEELQGSALLTPPPSPPAFIRPITTPAQAVPEPEVVSEATEQLEESKAPAVEGASEAQEQPEDSAEEPVEEDHEPKQKPETPTIPTALIPLVNKPIGASFFRFVLAFVAWLARPVFDKLYSFFGSNVLLWLACKIFGTGQPEPTFSSASSSEQEVVEVPDELVDGEEEAQSPQADTSVESKESDIPQREKALLRTYSELTVSDGSTMICEAEEEEEQQVTEEKVVHSVLSKVVEDVTPPPQAPTRLQIPQRQPLTITKSHLAVDARSEVISLLASIKSKDAALPELEVTINGERSRQPCKSSQVAEGVYLVELRLPSSDSAKLQVAVRQ